MTIKFDFLGIAELKKRVDELHAKLDILLSKSNYVSPALEQLIKEVSARAVYIEKKV